MLGAGAGGGGGIPLSLTLSYLRPLLKDSQVLLLLRPCWPLIPGLNTVLLLLPGVELLSPSGSADSDTTPADCEKVASFLRLD